MVKSGWSICVYTVFENILSRMFAVQDFEFRKQCIVIFI
uniref:Uncharacterized protein n=1 Tax=Anguilla anguilla TaxID=7936 RepID=A0A0E9TEA5_ANGAN